MDIHEPILPRLRQVLARYTFDPGIGTKMTDKKKWFCTDCDDSFNDERGERCPMCGFRRICGPFKFLTTAECREAAWTDTEHTNGERASG